MRSFIKVFWLISVPLAKPLILLGLFAVLVAFFIGALRGGIERIIITLHDFKAMLVFGLIPFAFWIFINLVVSFYVLIKIKNNNINIKNDDDIYKLAEFFFKK
jgi:hypothetical protein